MSATAQQETMSFQTEVKQLLHLVTHSLYSNKEIFLRELVSNASDAADKLRFESLTDSTLFESDPDLKIWIDIDKTARTLTIRDNGIGMNREEVINNIGTIARSGTREYLERLGKEAGKDNNLIGQFGVGFYSAYVVADWVIVRTRRAGVETNQGVEWESDGQGEFKIKNIDKPTRGTEIILHIKDEEKEFLEDYRLRQIIDKYSKHVPIQIMMKKHVTEDEKKEDGAEEVYEVVNEATALWTVPKAQIKEEEYQALYKHISHDFENPLAWSHNRVEGSLDYINLLFIPTRAPFDLFYREHQRGLKLYVKRVFIMDDAEQLLPMYLRFVKGIVDSSDLPLNVSREILQDNRIIEQIKSGCVKRVLDMLEKLSKDETEKYATFWKEFGQVLKEGMSEDFANKDKIAKLLRFASTHSDTSVQNVSLEEYVSRMKPDQDKIYYIVAETFNTCKNSPHLEVFRKKGIEVLLLHDRVDEWLVAHMNEFEGKKLHSINKGDIDISGESDKAEEEKLEKDFETIIQQMQTILTDKVKEVRLTHRLTDSPACLVAEENEMSAHLQRILKASGQDFAGSKPILEINPKHRFLINLQSQQDDEQFKQWSWLLFEQAILAEGGHLEDPGSFVKRMNQLLLQ